MRHIRETLLDWQVYLHILIYMSVITPRECLVNLAVPRIAFRPLVQCLVSHCSCRESYSVCVIQCSSRYLLT